MHSRLGDTNRSQLKTTVVQPIYCTERWTVDGTLCLKYNNFGIAPSDQIPSNKKAVRLQFSRTSNSSFSTFSMQRVLLAEQSEANIKVIKGLKIVIMSA